MVADLQKHPVWTGVLSALVTSALAIVAAIFLFGRQVGSLRQELNDLVAWKKEAAPQITKIDRSGSLSFENWKANYENEQRNQYKRLDRLEEETSHLETMKLQIWQLEQKVGDGKPRP